MTGPITFHQKIAAEEVLRTQRERCRAQSAKVRTAQPAKPFFEDIHQEDMVDFFDYGVKFQSGR